ncbi:MAG: ketoacyl-ACP synthase III [Holosporales bacterium]|jgi:3-oxoacyl-[acyl-carrier-protein] synthase-3|nr:ketoacyl-ACP synthase III [Holosporales bacterium]
MNFKKSVLSSFETYLPERVVTNDDISKFVDTTHEWIFERTGIERRHLVEKNQYTHDIAVKSALKTLKSEGIGPLEIDAIIIATATSEKRCPSTSALVQGIIGASNAFAFDIQAACSGFIYALTVADSFIKSGIAKKILLISTETLSLFTDWSDRSTCILFGDGAGSCIVKENDDDDDCGIIATKLYADGTKPNLITIENSEKNNNHGHLTMQGRAVFKYAIEYMYKSMIEILEENCTTFDDIDWIIPHQANRRILESMSKMKGVPFEKIAITINEHANTSSASIPLVIDTYIKSGKIKKGDKLLLSAIGAGLVYGSALIKL